MSKARKSILAAAAFVVLASAGHAQAAGRGAGGMSESDDMQKFMRHSGAEMQRMKMTGDIDVDFVTAMRRHHQAGIRMAEMALAKGDDPKARELAQRIVEEQRRDLKEFDAWLAEHGSTGAAK